jgi:hypothetical protein
MYVRQRCLAAPRVILHALLTAALDYAALRLKSDISLQLHLPSSVYYWSNLRE